MMTREQLQQIRDALEHWHEIETSSGSVIDYTDELDILDAALSGQEQEPVGCKHNRYSVDVHEQTGTCYDCGAEGRMRFVVDAPAHPMPEPAAPQPVASISVTQLSAMAQSLEVDENQTGYHWRKGWNDALRQAMDYARTYTAPVPAPQRECETCARKRERLLKAGFLKSPLRTKNEEKNHE